VTISAVNFRTLFFSALVLAVCVSGSVLYAQEIPLKTCTFIGAKGAKWSEAENWETGTIPKTLQDRALFPATMSDGSVLIDILGINLGELALESSSLQVKPEGINTLRVKTLRVSGSASLLQPRDAMPTFVEVENLVVAEGGTLQLGFYAGFSLAGFQVSGTSTVAGRLGIACADASVDLGALVLNGTMTLGAQGIPSIEVTVRSLKGAGKIASSATPENSFSGMLIVKTPADAKSEFSGSIGNALPNVQNPSADQTMSLTKEGPGAQILTGASTFTGPTAIRGGTLILGPGGSLASPVTGEGGKLERAIPPQ